MKKFIQSVAIVLGAILLSAGVVEAINITVPSAPSAGYDLTSTSAGAYIATSTSPRYFNYIAATSTTATSTFGAQITVGGNIATSTFAGHLVAGSLTSATLNSPNQMLIQSGNGYIGYGGINMIQWPHEFYGKAGFNDGIEIAGSDLTTNGSAGNPGDILVSGGASAMPSWTAPSTGGVGWATTTADTESIYFYGKHNVGIGSTSPWAALSVASTTQGPGTLPLFTVASSSNATLFTVFGTGAVGIGTTTPRATSLNIQKNDNNPAFLITGQGSGGTFDAQNGVGFYLTFNATNNRQFVIADSVSLKGFRFLGNTIDGYSNGSRADISFGTDSNAWHTGNHPGTTNSTYTSISNRGGSVPSKPVLVIQGDSAGSGGTGVQTGDLFAVNLWGDTNTGKLFVIGPTGNVGIGTSSPFAQLSITGTTTKPTLIMSVASSTGQNLFTILGNGNVGIGSSSPYAPLTVSGLGVFDNIFATSTTATSTLNGGFNLSKVMTPTTSSMACTIGDIAHDADYIYVCTAANTWKRSALTAF